MSQHQLQNRKEKELVWFQRQDAGLTAKAQHGSDLAVLTAATRINNNGLLN